MDSKEYIEIPYETIGTRQIAKLRWLVNSTMVNALTENDYLRIIDVFKEVTDRLPDPEEGK